MKALARYQLILLGEQRHIGVNNLPKVVARQCRGRELNSRPLDHESDTLATTPPSHRVCASYNQFLDQDSYCYSSFCYFLRSPKKNKKQWVAIWDQFLIERNAKSNHKTNTMYAVKNNAKNRKKTTRVLRRHHRCWQKSADQQGNDFHTRGNNIPYLWCQKLSFKLAGL